MSSNPTAERILVDDVRRDLELAVSKLDALHRVESARIVPMVLHDRGPGYFPGVNEVSI